MARADWLFKLRISCVLFTSEQLERKWRPVCIRDKRKKSSKLIVCGVYYLTVLVYTKTTIHLSVGG